MTRNNQGSVPPGAEDGQVINDPGNEDPGSLLDDARVPLQEEPDAGDAAPAPAD